MSVKSDRNNFMAGMVNACNIVAKDGLEGLKKEMRFRNITSVPVSITPKQADDYIQEISTNVYNCMLADVGVTLDVDFGFRKQRMDKFRTCYEKRARQTLDMNWVGNHYVTLEDYAKYMNSLYDWKIDESVARTCQERADKENETFKMVKLERLITELTEHGYGDAATWLLKEWKDY